MIQKQISVFLENKKGRLAEVTALIAREGINIRALSLADTADFGVLRLIVNDPEKCVFDRHGLNIEYMYAFLEKKSENAIVIFRVDQPAKAVQDLESEGITVLSAEILSKL
jgi:hypothetical protein